MNPLILSNSSIAKIASRVRHDWKNVSSEAEPYLQFMEGMQDIMERAANGDAGVMVVTYFVVRSKEWKGPMARAVRKELRKRISHCPNN